MDREGIGRVIRTARQRANLKQETLAQQTGCTAPYITMMEKGRSLPSAAMAVRLEQALNLPSGSLLTPVLAIRVNPTGRGTASLPLPSKPASSTMVAGREEQTDVPVLRDAPAAAERIVPREIAEHVQLPAHAVRGRRMYLVPVHGDAMERDGLHDGDLVLVDADAAPRHGDVVVARIGRDWTIRRFYRTDQRVSLVANSPSWNQRPLSFAKPAQVELRGVVDAIYLKRLR